MASKSEFAKLLATADRKGLKRLSKTLDTATFLKTGLAAFKSLTLEEQKVASNIRDVYELDRLDGLLMLITEFEMPDQPCFGPSLLGVSSSDYDIARTFILKNMRGLSGKLTPQPTKPFDNFYPELTGKSLVERLLFLGQAHAGISVKDDRQINLASCSGRYNYVEARSLIQRTKGTTCAVFLRALLDAARDQRIQNVKGAFKYYPDMVLSLGCNKSNYLPIDNGWIRGDRLTTVKRGDLYLIRDSAGGGSGHVGIVKSVSKTGNTMKMITIDGGQGTPGVRLEVVTARKFIFEPDATQGQKKDPCPWVNVNPGARRRLQGIVRLPA